MNYCQLVVLVAVEALLLPLCIAAMIGAPSLLLHLLLFAAGAVLVGLLVEQIPELQAEAVRRHKDSDWF